MGGSVLRRLRSHWARNIKDKRIAFQLLKVKPFIYTSCCLCIEASSIIEPPEEPFAVLCISRISPTETVYAYDGVFGIEVFFTECKSALKCTHRFRFHESCCWLVRIIEYTIHTSDHGYFMKIHSFSVFREFHADKSLFSEVPLIQPAPHKTTSNEENETHSSLSIQDPKPPIFQNLPGVFSVSPPSSSLTELQCNSYNDVNHCLETVDHSYSVNFSTHTNEASCMGEDQPNAVDLDISFDHSWISCNPQSPGSSNHSIVTDNTSDSCHTAVSSHSTQLISHTATHPESMLVENSDDSALDDNRSSKRSSFALFSDFLSAKARNLLQFITKAVPVSTATNTEPHRLTISSSSDSDCYIESITNPSLNPHSPLLSRASLATLMHSLLDRIESSCRSESQQRIKCRRFIGRCDRLPMSPLIQSPNSLPPLCSSWTPLSSEGRPQRSDILHSLFQPTDSDFSFHSVRSLPVESNCPKLSPFHGCPLSEQTEMVYLLRQLIANVTMVTRIRCCPVNRALLERLIDSSL